MQGVLSMSRRETHAVNMTECKPMRDYTAAEMSAWLATQGFTLDPAMGGIIDGESLIGFVDSPNALSETSILLKLFPVHEIAKVVHQVRNSKIEPMTELPPVLDKCSLLFQQDDRGSVVETSAVVEKILELNSDLYTFEVIFSVALVWEEDRVDIVLPQATPDEMDECPEHLRCGVCFFAAGETCKTRMAQGYTDPRSGFVLGVNKCCSELWNPVRDDNPFNGIFWPNAKEIEILSREGPTYYTLPPPNSLSLAYTILRIRGVFYVPMNFRAFPHDGQFLDIHMSTMASNWQFNLTQPAQHKDPIRTADYVAGGPLLPQEEKVRMGLNAESACDVPHGDSVQSHFEDLSGWSISKAVQVLSYNANTKNCMWHSPCDAVWAIKFTLLREWYERLGVNFNEEPSGSFKADIEREERSFIIFRISACRRAVYFIENIVLIVIILNVVNVLSLALPPTSIDMRLGSCATMVLALAAIQAFVADSTPRAGYLTDGLWFIKVSNFFMVAAGAESVLVYLACVHKLTLTRLFVKEPTGELCEAEMSMFDHIFLTIYVMVYLFFLEHLFGQFKQFTGLFQPVCIVGGLVVAGLIVLHSLRLRKIVQSLSVKHEIEMQAAEPTLSPETTRKEDESEGGEGGPRQLDSARAAGEKLAKREFKLDPELRPLARNVSLARNFNQRSRRVCCIPCHY